jgi:hypothetical protein
MFSIISLFLITSCKGGGDAAGTLTTPFLGGSQGLEMKFLQGNPPAEVTDDGNLPFKAIVTLVNQGEFDLASTQVEVGLSGFLAEDFGVTAADKGKLKNQPPDDNPIARKKDSEGNILEAIEVSVPFPSKADGDDFNYARPLPGNRPFLFRAEVCYRYGAQVVSEICVLKNMIDIIDDAPCDPSESKSVFSSASPLGITAFRQNVVGKDKIQFSFDIVHSGSGDVFAIDPDLDNARIHILNALIELKRATLDTTAADKQAGKAREILNKITTIQDITEVKTLLGSVTEENLNKAIAKLDGVIVDCPKDASVRRSKEDKVRVTVDTGIKDNDEDTAPDIELICVGLGKNKGGIVSGLANLVNGKRTVTCTQTFSTTRPDFIQPMDITLDFNYLDSIDKNILVKHLG